MLQAIKIYFKREDIQTYKHGENRAFQFKIRRRELTMEWRVNNKRDLQDNSTTTEKDTNVTTANKLEGGECHHGQQIKTFLPKNTTYHTTSLTSHTIMQIKRFFLRNTPPIMPHYLHHTQEGNNLQIVYF